MQASRFPLPASQPLLLLLTYLLDPQQLGFPRGRRLDTRSAFPSSSFPLVCFLVSVSLDLLPFCVVSLFWYGPEPFPQLFHSTLPSPSSSPLQLCIELHLCFLQALRQLKLLALSSFELCSSASFERLLHQSCLLPSSWQPPIAT